MSPDAAAVGRVQRLLPRHWETLLFLGLLVAAGTIMTAAMRRTSTTFDEIVLIAGGARGYATGNWSIAPEHPPLTQYLYGLPVFLTGPKFPDESRIAEEVRVSRGYRYLYAQLFFWRSGNDPQRLAFLGRLPAVAAALLLIGLTWRVARRVGGAAAGLLAAGLVAFTPDVLAHGGIAYNDVPVALAMLAALWSVDRAIREPTVARGIAAGGCIALALATKNSAVALAPIVALLFATEAALRGRDGEWWRRLAVAAGGALVACYLGLVLVYRGDPTLLEYRYSLLFASQHVGGNVPAYLWGTISSDGFWYYFPVAFLYKTSAAYHMLIILAAGAAFMALRDRPSLRAVLASPLRAPATGLGVFGALLISSDLNIGFRYALPALPMLAILTAAGVVTVWQGRRPAARIAVVVTVVWAAAHPLSYYPHFLTYVSEYGPGRDQGYRVLADSSLDWGQGLLALREYMQQNRIDRVALSYFGSGLPAGYGIDYEPLPSFFPLPNQGAAGTLARPQWIAISATNLAGVYLPGDPFRALRDIQPAHVVANSIYLYRLAER